MELEAAQAKYLDLFDFAPVGREHRDNPAGVAQQFRTQMTPAVPIPAPLHAFAQPIQG